MKPRAPRILLLDIETAPNLAYVWGLWKQDISIDKIVNSGYVMCWSAKWLGETDIMFDSVVKHRPKAMCQRIHKLLCQADIVVHYNGTSFDMPTLNKEFVELGMLPPSPYKQVDLLLAVRKAFRFSSNKLDYVSKQLGLGTKLRHPGFQMWVDCMAKDKRAWEVMEKYNRQDVALLETLYHKVLPWITGHPNLSNLTDTTACTNCGSINFYRNGWAYTQVMKYPRFQCRDCGTYFRGCHSMKGERKERVQGIAG